jgi:hypothetical protein
MIYILCTGSEKQGKKPVRRIFIKGTREQLEYCRLVDRCITQQQDCDQFHFPHMSIEIAHLPYEDYAMTEF